jgi:DNA mismatch repair ATPase MutL
VSRIERSGKAGARSGFVVVIATTAGSSTTHAGNERNTTILAGSLFWRTPRRQQFHIAIEKLELKEAREKVEHFENKTINWKHTRARMVL